MPRIVCAPLRIPNMTSYLGPGQTTICTTEIVHLLKPKAIYTLPLEKGDHPELDGTDFCTPEQKEQYQSLIGQLQWTVSLGRMDINTAVMTLGSFRTAPRIGHLERAKRVVGFLCRFKHAMIRFRTELPDYSDLPDSPPGDWGATVYGDVKEVIPDDVPEALGNEVVHTSYFDANLYHCLMTGTRRHWHSRVPQQDND